MPQIEQALKAKWDGVVKGNIHIEVRKNMTSTSKAENVNYGLTLLASSVEFIAIMDADHQPCPSNATAAITAILRKGLDIVQGSCTIRNFDNLLSRVIAIEFEDIYNVGHQGKPRPHLINVTLLVATTLPFAHQPATSVRLVLCKIPGDVAQALCL